MTVRIEPRCNIGVNSDYPDHIGMSSLIKKADIAIRFNVKNKINF
ncbi:MAG: hypothetical protein PHX78_06945 [bacterium]|nr:hypothetical protein [bacterium]